MPFDARADLPSNVHPLETVEAVKAAWPGYFIVGGEIAGDGEEVDLEESVAYADQPRVVIAADAIYFRLEDPVISGPKAEQGNWVRLRKPTVADMLLGDKFKGGTAKLATMIEALAGIPSAQVKQMSIRDFGMLGDIIENFT